MKKLGQVLFLALLATSACAEEYPEEPTWNGEIELIISANCGRCHGEELHNGAPAGSRLVRFRDAMEWADRILGRTIYFEDDPFGRGQMPPDSYLTNDQKEALERWVANGMPLGE